MSYPVWCPDCEGKKFIDGRQCAFCDGRGWVDEKDVETMVEQTSISNTEHIYNWTPKPDITVYELACCLPLFSADWHQITRIFNELPEGAKRHWKQMDYVATRQRA